MANQEDGVSQADVDAVQADLDAANAALDAANATAASLQAALAEAEAELTAFAEAIADADTECQAELTAAMDAVADANAAAASLQAELDAALANQEDGISQVDVDAAYADGVASVTPEDGVSQADVDAAVSEAAGVIADLQAQLDDALLNSCAPIFIDIIEGWNILGYTLSFEQDVAATLSSIEETILIVKDNNASVYWPEFGFNGIGNFTPGQGYQIKTSSSTASYTWPNVNGERIDMSPTVPQWAADMQVDVHPNDIRSLVKVVNMLGQEVNVEDQFKGEVVLYLYNDGTVEKKIVQ